ncbi:MAG: hypothetical protein ACLTS6_04070 [Anaerobutyricum sp.]
MPVETPVVTPGSHENTEKGNFDDQCDRKNDGGGRKRVGKHRRYHMETRIFGHCEKGMVISQNVSAGEWVSADQKLVLTISKGQGRDRCAEVAWIDAGAGKKKLKKAHLTYKIQQGRKQ